MNAGGVDEACKSNEVVAMLLSGGRVSNTRIICLLLRNNHGKPWLIPHDERVGHPALFKVEDLERDFAAREEFVRYQLVGVVTAYQG